MRREADIYCEEKPKIKVRKIIPSRRILKEPEESKKIDMDFKNTPVNYIPKSGDPLKRDLLFNNYDLLFYLSDFLDDTSSNNLFLVNKSINNLLKKYSHRYSIKKYVSNFPSLTYWKEKLEGVQYVNDLPLNEMDQRIRYKIKKKALYIRTSSDLNIEKSIDKAILYFSQHFEFNKNTLTESLKVSNIRYLYLINFEGDFSILPSSVIFLSFSNDKPLNNLPPNLQTLILGWSFNQSVDNLPTSLTKLRLGYNFNQPINNLPSNLKYLVVHSKFEHKISKLPPSLIYLDFGVSVFYKHSLLGLLPDSIQYLGFPLVGEDGIEFNTPKSLKYIYPGPSRLKNDLEEKIEKDFYSQFYNDSFYNEWGFSEIELAIRVHDE